MADPLGRGLDMAARTTAGCGLLSCGLAAVCALVVVGLVLFGPRAPQPPYPATLVGIDLPGAGKSHNTVLCGTEQGVYDLRHALLENSGTDGIFHVELPSGTVHVTVLQKGSVDAMRIRVDRIDGPTAASSLDKDAARVGLEWWTFEECVQHAD